ncbi:MAG: biotin/lipoyl-binding protein, partial [Planctomycetales bacterium]|nr:biotin/lipoyl-binding protein [Planctomycetales bacterium]
MNRLRLVVKVLLFLSIVGGAIYWLRFRPVPVNTHAVTQAAIIDEVMGTGTLEARVSASISPKISGRLLDVHVDQGDRVAKDQ